MNEILNIETDFSMYVDRAESYACNIQIHEGSKCMKEFLKNEFSVKERNCIKLLYYNGLPIVVFANVLQSLMNVDACTIVISIHSYC